MHVEHETEQPGTVLTPEALAGQELRRLRRIRGWSQEEVARRMAAIGYAGWRQSTVGRTETAQRPLRLNEAVDLAALFAVPFTQLAGPLPADPDRELRRIREGRERTARQLAELAPRLEAARREHDELAGRHRLLEDELDWADSHIGLITGALEAGPNPYAEFARQRARDESGAGT